MAGERQETSWQGSLQPFLELVHIAALYPEAVRIVAAKLCARGRLAL
jgi:hypothetical protein